jgi:hypothetical protein
MADILAAFCNILVFVAFVRHLKTPTAVREIEFQHRNAPGTNFTSHRSIEIFGIYLQHR